MDLQGSAYRVMAGLCLAMLLGQPSFAKVKHYGQLFHPSGKPHAGARLRVFSRSGPATLSADAKGTRPLANPVTTGKDGVYWFYADNGIYHVGQPLPQTTNLKVGDLGPGVHRHQAEGESFLIVRQGDQKTAYRVIEEGVTLWDPREPRVLTATSEAPALTLMQIDSQEGDIGPSVVFEREHGPGSPQKGPWRWIANEVAAGQPPASFNLVYNTDLIREPGAKGGFQWARRDVEDVCIRLRMTPAKGTGGPGFGGYLDYAVAPKGRAGSPPIFENAMQVKGPAVLAGGSLLTVGGGMDHTRYIRTYQGRQVPFPLTGAGFVGGAPAETRAYDTGQVWVPETDPAGLGKFRRSAKRAEKNPTVVSGGGGNMFHFASVGKALVKLAPEANVKPGDTLVASNHAGCADVDNEQRDATRIVGWALEKSGATLAGFVLIVVK